jgi:23S rRNA pseudouridine955/2504/2580 synthase
LLNLHRQLREGRVKKTYLACSLGKIEQGLQLVVEKPLLRFYNKKGERMVKIDLNGQHAITKIKGLETYKHKKYGWVSLLQCEPLTGRTHQIRVHLQSIKLPIFGDQKYGNLNENLYSDFQRMFLHAWKLRFYDLGSDAKVNYVAQIPISFAQVFSEFKFFEDNHTI